jgi:hypothetical protein
MKDSLNFLFIAGLLLCVSCSNAGEHGLCDPSIHLAGEKVLIIVCQGGVCLSTVQHRNKPGEVQYLATWRIHGEGGGDFGGMRPMSWCEAFWANNKAELLQEAEYKDRLGTIKDLLAVAIPDEVLQDGEFFRRQQKN